MMTKFDSLLVTDSNATDTEYSEIESEGYTSGIRHW
jgi:hypothetical protein